MLIIWGTKIKRRKAGVVADYCYMCHDLSRFDLIEVRSVSHVYYVPLGFGKVVGHEVACRGCHVVVEAKASVYAGVARDARGSLDDLVAETQPDVRTRYAARFELEDRVRRKALTPDERLALMRGLLEICERPIALRAAETHFDAWSALGCVGTFAVPVALLVGAAALRLDENVGAAIAAVVLVAGLVFTIGALVTDWRRFARQKVSHTLARGLAILEPTRQELSEILGSARAAGRKAGVIRPEDVVGALAAHGVAPPAADVR